MGADLYANNASGGNYTQALQVSTGRRSMLHKIVVSSLTTTVYLWVFDVTAGSSASVAPRMIMEVPGGVCATLDLQSGTPFVNGIYVALSTANATNASSTVTAAASNAAILDVSYRLE